MSHLPPTYIPPVSSRAAAVNVDLRFWLMVIVMGLSLIVLLPAIAATQALPPATEFDRSPDRRSVELSGEAKSLARSWVYVLDQLAETIDDYTGYFESYSDETRLNPLRNAMTESKERLDKGIYHLNARTLDRDLRKMAETAKSLSDDLMDDIIGARPTNEQQKLVKLARHFEQDLLIIREQLEFEVIEELEDESTVKAISLYFADSLRNISRVISSALTVSLESIRAAQQAHAFRSHENAEMWERWADSLAEAFDPNGSQSGSVWVQIEKILENMPDIPEMPQIPALPEIHSPTPMTPPSDQRQFSVYSEEGEFMFSIPGSRRVMVRRPGEISVVQVFADSTHTVPQALPIHVQNPIGQVTVIGWPGNTAVVRAEVEVAAKSENQARSLMEQIELQLNQRADMLTIEAVMPTLSDPTKRVVSCNMHLKIPHKNTVVVTSSFGDIHLSKMQAPVTIKGSNSRVTVDQLSGDLVINTTVSDLFLDEISGTATISNTLGSIEMSDVSGNVTITNSTGSVAINNSRGSATIRNSGPIEVREHNGPVDIDNSNGAVLVRHVQGDLLARNANQPLRVESITGATTISNINASIAARDIRGLLTATNTQGAIDAIDLFGPIHLTNTRGTIGVTLSDADYTGSTINSSFGVIKLRLANNANLTLNAEAVGGHIQSQLPVALSRVGETQTGTLKVGDGHATVTVKGTNSSITIDRAK
jgi:DUF4097 and DUF4098 domain-containing protein YvlB